MPRLKRNVLRLQTTLPMTPTTLMTGYAPGCFASMI